MPPSSPAEPRRDDASVAFDVFYKQTRERLLLQTWALTGDLAAARSAVRHAYVVAWHHWPKVSRRDDPESWLRPHAWAYAQRRHTARLGHRDKDLDPDLKATLDALGTLPLARRRVLLLSLLTPAPLDELAREVGLPRDDAERELRTATAEFAAARGVTDDPDGLAALLGPLAAEVAEVRWPRPSIIRRSGSGRRRTHTAAGVLATVAVLVVSGVAVADGGVRATLDREGTTRQSTASGGGDGEVAQPPLVADALLGADDVQQRAKGTGWSEGRTDGNTEGDGTALPCQEDRYADPRGTAALVRTFEAKRDGDGPRRTAWQMAEVSRSERASGRTYRRAVSWYAGCTEPRTQLLSTRSLGAVGDQAMLLTLRSWERPVRTTVVGVARTGLVTTTTVLRVGNDAAPDVRAGVALLAEAVRGLCGLPDGGSCVGKPEPQLVRPVAVGEVPSLLSEIDLPPVQGVAKPWTGSPTVRADQNAAATPCDRTSFTGKGITDNVTRTFVVLDAGLPTEFGLTETVGNLPSRKAATAFVEGVRRRIDRCAEDDLTTEVRRISHTDTRREDLSVWAVTTELSDETTVRYLMAVLRTDRTVGQVGFVPAGGRTMGDGPFAGLARRALERLHEHPTS